MPSDHRLTTSLFAASLSLLFAGCEPAAPVATSPPPAPAVTSSPEPSANAGTPLAEPAERTYPGGITLTVPAGFVENPASSQFVLAEFRLPGEAGPARLTFSQAAGGLEANLDRWKGQFQPVPGDEPAKQSELKTGGEPATVLEASGTFRGMMAADANGAPDQRLWGAAIPVKDTHFFVKATGPAQTILAHRQRLIDMVQSIRVAE